MSDSHLPEDVNQWPEDPHAILGIVHGADYRTFRRAYAGLIRRYKPEQFPEEFRRIRDAYEALKFWFEMPDEIRARIRESSASDDEPDVISLAQYEEAPSDTAAEPERPSGPSFEQVVESLWQEANRGELDQAYRGLVELERQSPGREETCVRLYWMLALWPGLAPEKRAVEWIVRGLNCNGLAGRLLELYHNELEEDPDEAEGDRCRGLLSVAAPAARTAELAAARWAAARPANRSILIVQDLPELEPRLADDEDALAMLRIAALGHLAWENTPEIREWMNRCRARLEDCAAANHRMAHALTRCDFLVELAAQRERLRVGVGAPYEFGMHLYALLPALWNRPIDAVRLPLLDLLAPLVESIAKGLEIFDRLHSEVAAVLHELGQGIGNLYGHSPCSWNRPDLDRLQQAGVGLAQALPGLKLNGYDAIRPVLLRFCLREGITPGQCVELLLRLTNNPHVSEVAQQMAADAPLQYLGMANLAFWS
jgi:hypothetical protein